MYKNQLLEYFQKNKIDFPIFDTKKVGGEDHNPLWQSTVKYGDFIVVSDICKNKIEAEQSVSKKILHEYPPLIIYNPNLKHPIKKVKLTKNIALIVDLENNFNYESMENIYATYENLYMIGICSRNLNMKKEPTFEKMVVKSIAKDSADVAIIIFIMTLMKPKQFSEIVLLTRDHFGKTLEEVVNSDFITFTTLITHVMDDTEVHDFLGKYVS